MFNFLHRSAGLFQSGHMLPVLAATLCVSSGHVINAAEPPGSLRVYPNAVQLTDARDSQRLLVLQQNPDGSTIDVTDSARLTVSTRAS